MSCRFHLLDVIEHERSGIQVGTLTLRYDATEAEAEAFTSAVAEMIASRRTPSCALDVIDDRKDGSTLEEVGDAIGVTRERIRQLERKSLVRLVRAVHRAGVSSE